MHLNRGAYGVLFLHKHRLGRDEFLLVAHDALKDSSSLLKHLGDLYGEP
jgi:hypothetical protein